MYVYVPENVLNCKSLSGNQKIVLGFLNAYCKNGRAYFGGAKHMADSCGIEEKSVGNLLKVLEKLRLIRIEGTRIFYTVKKELNQLKIEEFELNQLLPIRTENVVAQYKEHGFEVEYVREGTIQVRMPDTQEWVIIEI